jgi:hypothetical protein
MGAVGPQEILATLVAVENSLRLQGYKPGGDGVMEACGVLA